MVPQDHGTLIDIGAGTGRAAWQLALDGWRVTVLDHASNCLDVNLPSIVACAWEDWGGAQVWDQGYCCDVMEHIPTEKIGATLAQIARRCRRAFFSIAFGPDSFGAVIGEPLHLTVEPLTWWVDALSRHFDIEASEDRGAFGVFAVLSKQHQPEETLA